MQIKIFAMLEAIDSDVNFSSIMRFLGAELSEDNGSMSTAATDLPEVSGKTVKPPLRFVTAASLFDGHDAAINIMRRLIQAQGAEVIHLGHNRSVDDIVRGGYSGKMQTLLRLVLTRVAITNSSAT